MRARPRAPYERASAVRARVAASLLREAVRAVDRLVAARLERHPGLVAAGRAGGREHLALAAIAAGAAARIAAARIAAGATAGLALGAALRAAGGLVGEPARGEELLLPDGEGKRLAAIAAGERLVGET